MYYARPYFITLGRVLMSIMFIQAGVSKIFGFAGAQSYMEAHGVPGMLLPLVILTEVGAGYVFCSACSPAGQPSLLQASACSRRSCSTGILTIRCR